MNQLYWIPSGIVACILLYLILASFFTATRQVYRSSSGNMAIASTAGTKCEHCPIAEERQAAALGAERHGNYTKQCIEVSRPVVALALDVVKPVRYSAGRLRRAVLWMGLSREVIALRSIRAVLIASVILLFVSTPVRAHHALAAQFDTKKTITLTGAVTKIDWSNPHVRLYIEVKNESNTVTWEVDMGSPNVQMMNGWKIDTYRRGDPVRVEAYPARNGSNVGYGRNVTPLRR